MISLSFNQLWEPFAALWWPFVRIMALLMTAPIFSARSVPGRVKILLGLVIAFTIAPLVAAPPPGTDFLLLLAQNMLVGSIIGFSLRIIFSAVELAGDLAGLQIGLGFALLFDPLSSRQSPLIGSFFGLLTSLIFLSINGHLMLITQLVESFSVVPLSGHSLAQLDVITVAGWGSELFKIALLLALPVVVVLLIVNLTLGIMARVAPQLSIFSIGFSVSLIAGLVTLTLTLPYLAAPIEHYLSTPLWTAPTP